MKKRFIYKPSILPVQEAPNLKNAVERELVIISNALQEVYDSHSSVDLTNYYRKDDAAPLQVIEAQTEFHDALTFMDDIDVDKQPTASVYPLVDFTKAQYVRVPSPVDDSDSATKKYVDEHIGRWLPLDDPLVQTYIGMLSGHTFNNNRELLVKITNDSIQVKGIVRRTPTASDRGLYRVKALLPGYTKFTKPVGMASTSLTYVLLTSDVQTQSIYGATSATNVLLSGTVTPTYTIVDDLIVFHN